MSKQSCSDKICLEGGRLKFHSHPDATLFNWMKIGLKPKQKDRFWIYEVCFFVWAYTDCSRKSLMHSPGRHKIVDEEKRFKHKLNMLEPGSRMLKWIGILIVIGLLLYFFRFRMAAICVWAVSGIVFAVLLVLLAIESHQDKVLNEIAIEENKKNGEI